MSFDDLLSRLTTALKSAEVPYMVTGSVASSAHGNPRSTRDLDIVVAPTSTQLRSLMQQFPSSVYYADEQQAMQALANRSQFNIIDHATGWKVDFIIAEDSEYGRTALERRKPVEISGPFVYVASAEDVVIAKLHWAKLGRSERQIQDAAGILEVQGDSLDIGYIERWADELELREQWQAARETSEGHR